MTDFQIYVYALVYYKEKSIISQCNTNLLVVSH